MRKNGLDGGMGSSESLFDALNPQQDGGWQKRMVYLYIDQPIAGEGAS
jgi:hypothetical protein